jgi:Flp pilus assembly protein TadD
MEMKRLLSAALVVIGIFVFSGVAYADPTVVVNGNTISLDAPPIIQNSRILVPMRNIFEYLGATVNWDSNTRTITATEGSTTIVLKPYNNLPTVNGNVVTLDTPPEIINNCTFVPLRFVSEALSCQVTWDATSQTVNISTSSGNSNTSTNGQQSSSSSNSSSALSSTTTSPDDLYTQGYNFYQSQDYNDALNDFLQYLKTNPTHPQDTNTYTYLGAIYYNQKDYSDAEQYLTKALSIDLHDSDASYYLGLTYEAENEPQLAVKVFANAVQYDSNDASMFNDLGVAYQQAGNLQAAQQAYQEAISLDPHTQLYQNNLNNVTPAVNQQQQKESQQQLINNVNNLTIQFNSLVQQCNSEAAQTTTTTSNGITSTVSGYIDTTLFNQTRQAWQQLQAAESQASMPLTPWPWPNIPNATYNAPNGFNINSYLNP